MKKIFNLQTYAFFFCFVMLCLSKSFAFAQDSAAAASSSTQSTTTTTEQHTAMVPSWVWVVGGIVLLIIIIALVRGKKTDGASHTDKVTYTKTSSTDDKV